MCAPRRYVDRMADTDPHRWARGDAPEFAIRPVLERLARDLAQRGWDQLAQLWAFRWVGSSSPAATAALDQHFAEARDGAGAAPGSSAVVGFALEELLAIEGHPFEGLLGIRLPPEYDGAILTTEAWDYPDDVKQASSFDGLHVPADMPPPSQHPRRVELRLLQAVSRSGDMLTLVDRRDGEQLTLNGDEATGRVVDALRRVVGLPTSGPGSPVALVLGRAWLAGLAERAVSGAVLDAAAVKALDPVTALVAILDEELPGSAQGAGAVRVPPSISGPQADSLAKTLGQRMTWEMLRGLAAAGQIPTGADPTVATWCDAPMFARLVTEATIPQRASLEVLASVAPAAAAEVQQRIRDRGWDEPDSYVPVTPAGRPGRNDPCPCGSGTKFKKCHGAPVPLLIEPDPRA